MELGFLNMGSNMEKRYINLTNGLEILNYFPIAGFDFIRIQSTACEQKRWNFILQDLDNGFLMDVAIGNECIIYDFGHNGRSRAVWQGVEFIKYVLTNYWLQKDYDAVVRNGICCSDYFQEVCSGLKDKTLKKLFYFKKFLLTDEIKIKTVSRKTDLDGKYGQYKEILEKNLSEYI